MRSTLPLLLVIGLLAAATPARPDARPDARNAAATDDSSSRSAATSLEQTFSRVDRLLERRVEADDIPGLAAGIVHRDGLAWARGYGVMALDDSRAVTPATRFRIASITKLFTATAIMILREQDRLALDDPVTDYLAWFEIRRPPGTDTGPVTIRHLLTHSSGLPRDSSLTDFDRLFQPSRDDAIAALPSQALEAEPGSRNAYSNLGYGILGEIVSAVSGQSYACFMERQIFAPLGMHETLVHPRPEDDAAWGHGPPDEAGKREKAGFRELGFATPAGGMASSVNDLAKFMLLNLAPYERGDEGDGPRILSAPVLREMHDVDFMVDPERGGVGMGWAVETSAGQHLVYHGGELPEQTSFMLLDLHMPVGIVVLTNAEEADPNGLAQDMLRIIRDAVLEPDRPYPAEAIPGA